MSGDRTNPEGVKGQLQRSTSALSLISRSPSEYNEILNVFIEPIPKVSILDQSDIISQRLTDLKIKADEIIQKYRVTKLAHTRKGTLTTHLRETFDQRIEEVTQTYETNKTILTVLLDEVCGRVLEENPLEDLDPSIVEMGRPINPNTTVDEIPIHTTIMGLHFTSTPDERTHPKQTIITASQTEKEFGQNIKRGENIKESNVSPASANKSSDERRPIDEDESDIPTLESILKHYGMDAKVPISHPNNRQLIDLQKKVRDLYLKGRQLQRCRESIPENNTDTRLILAEKIEKIGEKIETVAQVWGELLVGNRMTSLLRDASKQLQQHEGLPSKTGANRERNPTDNRRDNTNLGGQNLRRDAPPRTQETPQQGSAFTPELMLQMGATIATAIADSIRPTLSERTIDITQTFPRAKPVLQKTEMFKGELEEGLDWLEDFEVVAANNGWDNDQKAKSARFALQGPAKDWFKGIWPNDPPTWIEFVVAFRREYTPTGYKAALQQKLFATRKEKDETYNDLYLRVRRLCRRAFPEAEETEVVYYTVQALRGDKHFVSAASQTSIDGLQHVLKFADMDAKSDEATKKATESKPKPKQNFFSQQRQKPTKTDVNRSGAQFTTNMTTTPTYRPFDLSKMKCANCGNLGHSYRRCNKPYNKVKVDRYLAQQLAKTTANASRQTFWVNNPEIDVDIIQDIENRGAGEDLHLEEDARAGDFEVEEDSIEENLSVSTVGVGPINVKTHRVNTDKTLSPEVYVSINGVKVRSLVDSGSHCTIVDEKACQIIPAEKHRYVGPKLRSVCGELMTPEWVYPQLEITLGKRVFKVDVLVSKDINPPLILGVDAMKAGNFTANITTKKIIWTNIKTKPNPTEPPITTATKTGKNTRIDSLAVTTTKQISLHPFQTKFLNSTTNLTPSTSYRIQRICESGAGPAWITNVTPQRIDISYTKVNENTDERDIIEVQIPHQNEELSEATPYEREMERNRR